MAKTELEQKLHLSSLYSKSAGEFDTHKKTVVSFITGHCKPANASLIEKIGSYSPFSPSKALKTKEANYTPIIQHIVKVHNANRRSVSDYGILNQARFLDLVQALIVEHPAILTPEIFGLWSVAEWGAFLKGLYIKAHLEKPSMRMNSNRVSRLTPKTPTSSNAPASYDLVTIEKLKIVFEKFEEVISDATNATKLAAIKNTKSENNLNKVLGDGQRRGSMEPTKSILQKIAGTEKRRNSMQPTNNDFEEDDDLHIDIEHVSSKTKQKSRLKSSSVPTLPPMPDGWAHIYNDIHLSLNSLNAALLPEVGFPQAPQFETETNKLNELEQSMKDLLNQAFDTEKAELLAFEKADYLLVEFGIKNVDDAKSETSINAFYVKIEQLEKKKNEFSLSFQEQDTDSDRKIKITEFLNALKLNKQVIVEKTKKLNTLISQVEEKQKFFGDEWQEYELQQKTLLPAIKQQQKQQKMAAAA
ncbi:MAG: hypothetical protein K2Q14_06370 [Gammaproteobacteria bacterium]|nr:hypothetical protein [Gammaproteobacteria bacterium]